MGKKKSLLNKFRDELMLVLHPLFLQYGILEKLVTSMVLVVLVKKQQSRHDRDYVTGMGLH